MLGSSDGIALSVTVGDVDGIAVGDGTTTPASTATPGVVSGVLIPTSRGSIQPFPEGGGGGGGDVVGLVSGDKPLSTVAAYQYEW